MAVTKEQLEATLKFINDNWEYVYEYTTDGIVDEMLEPDKKHMRDIEEQISDCMNLYLYHNKGLIDKLDNYNCEDVWAGETLGFKRGFLTAILLRDVIL